MIKNYLTYINEKSEYGDKFTPYDIFEKLWPSGGMDEYKRIMTELMVGKYARFSVNKEKNFLSKIGFPSDIHFDRKIGLIEGYVESLEFIPSKPNFNVKIKNGKIYNLNCLGVVRVYDTKPVFISTKDDPYGEEDWDD